MSPQERTEFIDEVAAAVCLRVHDERSTRTSAPALSDEEQRWVRMAIQREAQSIDFRNAVIKKSLGSMMWALMLGLGYLALDFLRSHGFRP